MSELQPISEITKTQILNYFYINQQGQRLEAILETHSNNDFESAYISNSSFKSLATNLGINLDEFRFKYSTVSEVCEHVDSDFERCYEYSKVLEIFTALKAGLVRIKNHRCCYSEIQLCSAEMRDVVCRNQISNYPPGFLVNGGECLLNEEDHWMLSTHRLRVLGVLFYTGGKEYTLEQYPTDYSAWTRYWKKRDKKIRKALRLENQTNIIYKVKENLSEYY
jgi:hypothetical protein